MKKLFIIILLNTTLMIAQSNNFANNEVLVDNIDHHINQTDIVQLIQIQIDSALAMNERGEIKSNSFIADDAYENELKDSEVVFVPATDIHTKDKTNASTSKIMIIVIFSIAAASFVFIRRMFKPAEVKKKESFKEKFLALRNENLLIKEDSQSEELRKRLIKTYETDIVGNSLTIKAKELGISQGELMLAAKIKSFQLSELSESKI